MASEVRIFEYLDYKKYLQDWRKAEKEESPGLTHEYLCYSLGQRNRSFFSDLEKGRKLIGSEILERLIKLLGLRGEEAKYFRALVGYGQSSTYSEEEFWFEQIVQLNKAPKTFLDKDSYAFFKEWYHTVIRAFLDTNDITNEYDRIARSLFNRVTVREVENSIHLMDTLGLIERNESGYWKPTQNALTLGDQVKDECIKAYNVANLDVLREILVKGEKGTHNSSVLTVSTTREGMRKIESRINALRSEIVSIIHEEEGSSENVYQLAIHAFPLSKQERSLPAKEVE